MLNSLNGVCCKTHVVNSGNCIVNIDLIESGNCYISSNSIFCLCLIIRRKN